LEVEVKKLEDFKETRPAKDVEGFVFLRERDPFFRIYDEKRNFVDYDYNHHDLNVKIIDDDAVFYIPKEGEPFLDHSPETLGLTADPNETCVALPKEIMDRFNDRTQVFCEARLYLRGDLYDKAKKVAEEKKCDVRELLADLLHEALEG
jgi:hypothetical protein